MDDPAISQDLEQIKNRLAALASSPPGPGIAEELGAIRAQLRLLAEANDEVGDRLGEILGLRVPPRRPDA